MNFIKKEKKKLFSSSQKLNFSKWNGNNEKKLTNNSEDFGTNN